MNGSKLFTGDIQASGNITASNLWGISSKDITIALTTDWQDTGILLNDSILFSDGSGTYIIELYTNSSSVGSGYWWGIQVLWLFTLVLQTELILMK